MVTKNFAHHGETTCTGESVAHETAKLLIVKVICEQVDRPDTAERISLACECDCCKKAFTKVLPYSTFTSAADEVQVGRYRCDVVAFNENSQVLGIEVVSSNAVHDQKAQELPLPWIELRATDVLEAPYKWSPVNSRLKPALCKGCKARLDRLRKVASKWGQPLTEFAGYMDPTRAIYLAAVRQCWSCQEEMVSYWWPGVPFCKVKPPEPRPQTIQYRWSATHKDRYWANCCPSCGKIDEDNFLFLGLDGPSPFSSLPMGGSPTMESRRQDAIQERISFMLRHFK